MVSGFYLGYCPANTYCSAVHLLPQGVPLGPCLLKAVGLTGSALAGLKGGGRKPPWVCCRRKGRETPGCLVPLFAQVMDQLQVVVTTGCP